MDLQEFPDVITTKQAAAILRIHPSTVTRLIDKGVLTATKYFGRHWKIEAKHLKSLMTREFKRQETFKPLERRFA